MKADIIKSAVISPCGRYRYRLVREWNESGPHLPFVMLNPSTADASVDDPTIRRCIGFARRENFGGIIVANLYAFRATNPDDLWKAADPYGPDNDKALLEIAHYSAQGIPLICGWGVHGGRSNRPVVLMQQAGAILRCLGHTKGGHPRHPLYVRSDQQFEELQSMEEIA